MKPEECCQKGEFLPPLISPNGQKLSSILYCSYTGPSMNPTLREGDLLEVKAYGYESICIGDVILFKRESGIIVHRVVNVYENGLVTRGDNNIEKDPGLLNSKDVVGRVIAFWRGKRRKKVLRGSTGIIAAKFNITKNKIMLTIFDFLAPFYRLISSKGIFKWVSILAKPKIVKFGDSDLKLMFGSHEIGKYKEGSGWFIKPPFKLIIDDTSLQEVAGLDDLPLG